MSTKHMANLSDLPYDMLIEIAKLLKKPEDFTFFRSVSKSLRTVVRKEYFNGLPFRQGIPYLMLPVREDVNDNTREFYSLVESESIVTSLKVPNFKSKKCFESLGWLLVVEEDGRMSLLDPFSGTEIPVPHQNTFPEYEWYEMDTHIFIQKMVLSSRPSETSDFVLMIIAGGYGHLAYWRLGDKAWNRIEDRKGRFRDVVYGGGGQFYAVGNLGIVWVFNFMDNNNGEQPMIINCNDCVSYDYGRLNLYIHKNIDDSLLMIVRTVPALSDDGLTYETECFEVYEVDIATGAWKEIDSLGSMAMFLGENSTIVVDASRLSGGGVIKPNHIYFTDDNWEFYRRGRAKGGGADIGVYNFDTGDIESIYPGEPLLSRVSPSTWITPCF